MQKEDSKCDKKEVWSRRTPYLLNVDCDIVRMSPSVHYLSRDQTLNGGLRGGMHRSPFINMTNHILLGSAKLGTKLVAIVDVDEGLRKG